MKISLTIINAYGTFISDPKDLTSDEEDEFDSWSDFIKNQGLSYLSIKINGNDHIFKGSSIEDAIVKIEKIND